MPDWLLSIIQNHSCQKFTLTPLEKRYRLTFPFLILYETNEINKITIGHFCNILHKLILYNICKTWCAEKTVHHKY